MRFFPPDPDDYDSEEEYLDAVAEYEYRMDEMAEEKRINQKLKKENF